MLQKIPGFALCESGLCHSSTKCTKLSEIKSQVMISKSILAFSLVLLAIIRVERDEAVTLRVG